MAVGMGFAQLFRGIGQVGGVAVASAIFQSVLDGQLRQRITGPGADDVGLLYGYETMVTKQCPAHTSDKTLFRGYTKATRLPQVRC
jgi:hypothetical protein